MLTFDRYLLRSFLHIFTVCFISAFGLYLTIDMLENLDEFIDNNRGHGTLSLLTTIVTYYGNQSIFFLDRIGSSLMVVAVMVALVLFQRSGELHPLLSAGVPMYRVLRGLMVGPILLTGILVLNQELVVPQIAHAAYGGRGPQKKGGQLVEPIYDYSTRISINGETVNPETATLNNAQFVLPAPTICGDLTVLKASRAVFRKAAGNRPSGWILYEPSPDIDEIEFTDRGREIIRRVGKNGEMFVATPVSCDQLFKQKSSYGFLSTRELLGRIHNDAYGPLAVKNFISTIHTRLTQPLINLIAVFMTIPLLVRRESRGLVYDSGLCGLSQAVMFGLIQGCQHLGKVGMIDPGLASWLPVILGGGLCVWWSWLIRS